MGELLSESDSAASFNEEPETNAGFVRSISFRVSKWREWWVVEYMITSLPTPAYKPQARLPLASSSP